MHLLNQKAYNIKKARERWKRSKSRRSTRSAWTSLTGKSQGQKEHDRALKNEAFECSAVEPIAFRKIQDASGHGYEDWAKIRDERH